MRMNRVELVSALHLAAKYHPAATAKLMTEAATRLDATSAALSEAISQRDALAAELAAVEPIHADAVFITDEHYDQCPPEVQKLIRSIAALRFTTGKRFAAEMKSQYRAEGINYAAGLCAAAFNHGFIDKPMKEVGDVVRMILETKAELADSPEPAADGLSGEYAEKALKDWEEQLREVGQ